MAKLLNWAIIFLIIALILGIFGVSFLGIPSIWLVILFIVLAIIAIILGRHRRWF
ncbi:MAG: DUF1328 domain-containing protein [Methanotrichaceae archaeon]